MGAAGMTPLGQCLAQDLSISVEKDHSLMITGPNYVGKAIPKRHTFLLTPNRDAFSSRESSLVADVLLPRAGWAVACAQRDGGLARRADGRVPRAAAAVCRAGDPC